MPIIDNRIRDLVRKIDDAREITPELDELVRRLVRHVRNACYSPAVIVRYAAYNEEHGLWRSMPTDREGYVVGFDPLTQEDEFVECWQNYGIVSSQAIASPQICSKSIARIHRLIRGLSDGLCDLRRRETWEAMPKDAAGIPVISRGFFEIYHDECLASLRQLVRMYIHHVLILGRHDLWTTFDRLGVKLPGHGESKALPLHVDQNPNIHPRFKTVQGVLALTACPARRGTFVGVPGSKKMFSQYASMARDNGQYVELDYKQPIAHVLNTHAQILPLRQGQLISWDSRTTHANTDNVSNDTRMVAYISAGPANEGDEQAVKARAAGFKSGLGSVKDAMMHGAVDPDEAMRNFDGRDAMMHASKRPRYKNPEALARVRSPEKLTLLGRLLYGQESYTEALASSPGER
jgi:ectoine hydroxylase-related dioxygenase (phytanoyl-CoA dioxygenase family)